MSNVVGRIGEVVNHCPQLRWVDRLARKTGIVYFLHVTRARFSKAHAQVVAQRAEFFRKFYSEHQEEFQKIPAMLEDDFSRRTFEQVLKCRLTGDPKALKGVIMQPQYFQKDIFGPVEDEVFVDGGAYVGDTVDNFIRYFAGGYKKIYAWEPDEYNFTALKNNTKKLSSIVCVPCGLWDEKTELCFRSNGSDGAKIVGETEQETIRVPVDTIDNVCSDDKVTFIKMDIEGSEMKALEGAINVIKRDKPRLAICIYHKPEDLYEIPFWIKQTVPEYKLYIRHHSEGTHETVVYATL